MTLIERLRQVVGETTRYYVNPDGPKAAAEIERLRRLVNIMLENDPDDMAADGVTVLMVWRDEARAALKGDE